MFSCWVLDMWDIWWLFENVVLGSPKPSSNWTMKLILASISRRLLHSGTVGIVHVGHPSWCTFSPISLSTFPDFTINFSSFHCNPFVNDPFMLIWDWKQAKFTFFELMDRRLDFCAAVTGSYLGTEWWVSDEFLSHGCVWEHNLCAELWVTKGTNELDPLLLLWYSGARYL